MKRIVIFVVGCAALVALTWYAGAGAVARGFETLGVWGLLLVALVHLPVVALVGVAWWIIGRDIPGAARWKFIAARLVRNGAAEVLPFSQLGGFTIGVRVICLTGVGLFRSALSMFSDLVVEFSAKLPYALIGLLLLLSAQPNTTLLMPLSLGIGLTAAAITAGVIFRVRLKAMLERSALVLVRKWTRLAPSEDVHPRSPPSSRPTGSRPRSRFISWAGRWERPRPG